MRARLSHRLWLAAAAALASTTIGIPLVAAPASASPDAWTATGPGTVTVLSDGTLSNPSFSYNYCNGSCSGGGGVPATRWTFQAGAQGETSVTGTYLWTGNHAYCDAFAELQPFIVTVAGPTTLPPLVDEGNNCNAQDGLGPIDGGFEFSGSYTFNLSGVSSYGFYLIGSNGDSEAFLAGTFTYATYAPLPPAPNLLAATESNGAVEVSWSPPTGASPTAYLVYEGTTSGGEIPDPVASVSGCTTVAQVTTQSEAGAGLPPPTPLISGTSYYFTVVAVYGTPVFQYTDGTSAPATSSPPSNEILATAGVPDAPSAPTGLTALAVANGAVSLTWDAPSAGPSPTCYEIFDWPSSGSQPTAPVTTVSAPATSVMLTTLDGGTPFTDGTTYDFTVVALDSSGASPAATPATIIQPNTSWFTAQNIPLTTSVAPSGTTTESIDQTGESVWYDFAIQPDEQVSVSLTNVAADYDIALFSDIDQAYEAEAPATSTPNLLDLGAEAPGSAATPSDFTPSDFTPSDFTPSDFTPSDFTPSDFTPSDFTPSDFTPSDFTPSDFTASYSNAQVDSLLAVSTEPGAVSKSVSANTWNNTGNFYIRVSGNDGAFAAALPFTLTVTTSGSPCASGISSNPINLADLYQNTAGNGDVKGNVNGPAAPYESIIVENSTSLGGLYPTDPDLDSLGGQSGALQSLANASTVDGVVVDVGQSAWVSALAAQAKADPTCPYAENLEADAIQDIINTYRTSSTRFVVIVGDDDVIPFFRYPDTSGLAPESDYQPPLSSESPAGAALGSDEYLSDDQYGALTELNTRGQTVPLATAAVGRLVETPTDIYNTIENYLGTSAKRGTTVISAHSSLVTGYDFIQPPASQIASVFQAGGATPTPLIETNGATPAADSNVWNASQLLSDLSGINHYDLAFIGAHFSANNLLAGDGTTTLTTNQFASQVGTTLQNSLVLSPGCHSGYTIDPADAIPGVTDTLSWPQAFTEAGAALIAGTGYQYGDTNYVAYSDQVYVDLAQQLGYKPTSATEAPGDSSAIAVGSALLETKLEYLAGLDDLNGLEEKALLQITLYGLPMLGVEETEQSSAPLPSQSVISGATPVGLLQGQTTSPAQQLGLEQADLSVNPTLSPETAPAPNANYTYDSGPQGQVSDPGGPVLPLQIYDVNVSTGTLRGVGFWGGRYTDASATPLTGDPATDTGSTGIVPFSSPVFYPETLWNPNYFQALIGGGDTELALTPVQYESGTGASDDMRTYDNLDLHLFYSNNTASYTGTDPNGGPNATNTPALAAPPAINDVTSMVSGDQVTISAHVTGDPSAGIQEVWVTYTGTDTGTDSGPLYGAWQSVDLSQSSADSTLWTGTIADASGTQIGNPTADMQFIVQAVNGVGEVSLENNDGYNYTPDVTPGAPLPATANTYSLTLSGATSGQYLGTASVSATLAATGPSDPSVSGQTITFNLGATTVTGVTGPGGVASVNIPVAQPPNSYTLSATYAGDANDQGVAQSASFQVTPAPTILSVSVPGPIVSGQNSGISATLTSTAGTADSPLPQKSVYFVVSNANGPVVTTSAITNANGVAQAGALNVPPADTGTNSMTDTVRAYFGSSVPLPSGGSINAPDPDFAASSSTASSLGVSAPPTVQLTVPSQVTATGASTPVAYTAKASYYDGTPFSSPQCSPGSGSGFAVGLTTISCTATDQYGNSGSSSATVVVTKAPLTISVSGTQTYGGTPTWSFTASGLVGQDLSSVINGPLSCSTSSVTSSSTAPGSYAISSCSGLTVPGYYSPTYTYGNLTISRAPLTITAPSATINYGQALPSATPIYAGFVNHESASALTTAPSCNLGATQSSLPGTYYPSCTGAVDANYSISYVTGTLTINQAPLNISISGTQIYGGSPTWTFSASGFVNNDNSSKITGPPLSCTTYPATTSASSAATYPIYTCSSLTAPSYYAVSYTYGSLVIGQAPLTITASSPTITYGQVPPTITASYAGALSSTIASSLTTNPSCTTKAIQYSAPGTYSTNCSGAVDPDYSPITYAPGTLTIAPAPLTITASGAQTYGSSPIWTYSESGLLGTDKISGTLSCSTSASKVGSYSVASCTGLTIPPHYTVTYTGSLTIAPAPLTVTAPSAAVTYGQVVPGVTPIYSVFANKDGPTSLTTQPTCSTTAPQAPQPGTYATKCSGAIDPNYSINYVPGAITVTPTTTLLLATGTTSLSASGQSTTSVRGAMEVNSADNGSVNVSGQSTLKTTAALISPSSAPVVVSGQSTDSLGSQEKLAAEQDPYASLSAPSTSGLTVYTSSTIQRPGVYTKAVTVSGQAHVTLATGTYIFDNGLTVSGQSTITSASGGVFLYFAGGSLSINGQSGAVLSPLTSGAYAGISLFEARTDTAAMVISGQGPTTSLSGALYAPGATIELSGQANLAVGELIANEAEVTGQSGLTVG